MKCKILSLAIVVLSLVACQNDNGKQTENPVEEPKDDVTISFWTKKIDADSTDAQAYFGRAQAYLEKYDPPNAVLDFNHAIRLQPQNPLFRKVLANYYFQAEKYPNAIHTLEEAIKDIPENESIRLLVAKYYIYTEQYEQGFLQLNFAEQLNPKSSDVHFYRGLGYRLQNDIDAAIKSYKKAIDLNADNYDAFIEMANIHRVQKNPLAVDYFKSAIRINPQSTEPMYDLGMYYQENDRYTEALGLYRDIIKMQPQNYLPHYNIGYLYFQMDSIDKAYTSFNRVVKLKTTNAKGYYMRGLCYEAKGDLPGAKDDFLQALTFDENLQLAKDGIARLKEKSQ